MGMGKGLSVNGKLSYHQLNHGTPNYKNYFFAIAQSSENLSCYYDAERIQSWNNILIQSSFQFLASSSFKQKAQRAQL